MRKIESDFGEEKKTTKSHEKWFVWLCLCKSAYNIHLIIEKTGIISFSFEKKKFGMEITVLVALNEESWCKV